MPTLHLRNVPADVLARLQSLATAERSSVSAVAIRELDMVSRPADNARLLAALPDTSVAIADAVAAIDEGRAAG